MTTSDDYQDHIETLEARAIAGDTVAAKSLAALALLNMGWRHGDPDPVDDGGDGEETV